MIEDVEWELTSLEEKTAIKEANAKLEKLKRELTKMLPNLPTKSKKLSVWKATVPCCGCLMNGKVVKPGLPCH